MGKLLKFFGKLSIAKRCNCKPIEKKFVLYSRERDGFFCELAKSKFHSSLNVSFFSLFVCLNLNRVILKEKKIFFSLKQFFKFI